MIEAGASHLCSRWWEPYRRLLTRLTSNSTTRTTHNRYFPEFTDLVASVEDALAAFARQPDRVKTLFGRSLKHLAESDAAEPNPVAETA